MEVDKPLSLQPKKILLAVIVFCLAAGGMSAFLFHKNSIHRRTFVNVFPKEKIQNPRIYYTSKYGYREDHSFPLDLTQFFYSFHPDLDGVKKIVADCKDCPELIFPVESEKSVFEIPGKYTQLNLGGVKVNLPRGQPFFNILVVPSETKVSVYISNIVQVYERQILNREFLTTFPFYIRFDGRISDSTEDRNYYRPIFERKYGLGIKKDGGSIYADDTLAKFRAVDFERAIVPWEELGAESCDPMICSRVDPRPYLWALSLLFAALLSVIFLFWKKIGSAAVRVVKRDRYFSLFLFFYSVTLFLIFREGIGDWDTDSEGLFFFVNKLQFSYTYSRSFQILSYLFSLSFYSARGLACTAFLATTIWYYHLILLERISSRWAVRCFLALVLFSPFVAISSFHTQRLYFSLLPLMLGLILTFYSFTGRKHWRYQAAAFASILLAALLRQDFALYFLPLALYPLCLGFTTKGLARAGVLIFLGFSLVAVGHAGFFQRSYSLVSYRAAFALFSSDLDPKSLSAAETNVLSNRGLLTDFMPAVDSATEKTFKWLVIRSIWRFPKTVTIHIAEKMQILMHGQNFYRGLNHYNNNPFDVSRCEGWGSNQLETVSNDAVARYGHYWVMKVAEEYNRFSLGYFYFVVLLPLLFFRVFPLSGLLAIAFLLKLVVVALAAPMNAHFYVEDIGYWLHFFPGILLVEYLNWRRTGAGRSPQPLS